MRALLLAGVVAVGWGKVAAAAPITATYDFTGTFNTGPNATVSGSVSLTFDPGTREQVTVNSFTSQALEGYTPVLSYLDGSIVTVGTKPGYSQVQYNPGENDFGLAFFVDSVGDVTNTTVPGSTALAYTMAGSNLVATSTSTSVTREEVAASSVPEPASLALFGSGLAGLFGLRRRRH